MCIATGTITKQFFILAYLEHVEGLTEVSFHKDWKFFAVNDINNYFLGLDFFHWIKTCNDILRKYKIICYSNRQWIGQEMEYQTKSKSIHRLILYVNTIDQ